jgi:hypothetical protein
MDMGKRKPAQETLFIAHDDLPRSAGHPFYVKLNQLLDEAGFTAGGKSVVRNTTPRKKNVGGRAFRRVSIFACCWSVISKASTVNAGLPGAAATVCRYGNLWASRLAIRLQRAARASADWSTKSVCASLWPCLGPYWTEARPERLSGIPPGLPSPPDFFLAFPRPDDGGLIHVQ